MCTVQDDEPSAVCMGVQDVSLFTTSSMDVQDDEPPAVCMGRARCISFHHKQ